MNRRLPTLLFASLFVLCFLFSVLVTSSPTVIAAGPAASSTIADLGTISGQVKDERNDTVQGADIVLLQGGETVSSTTTDSEGRFSLTAPSGSYNLTISKSDIITRTIQVEVIGGLEVNLGEVSVELVPSSTWILIVVVIVIGAIGLFLVGRRNQKLAKK